MTEPNVTPHEFKRLKEQLTARMIQILTEELGYTIGEAIDRVYTSPIYEKLSAPNTGLFFQSPRYVLSYIIKPTDYFPTRDFRDEKDGCMKKNMTSFE